MKAKHQVRVSSKRGRKSAGRKYRRQEAQDMRGIARGNGSGKFAQRRYR